MCVDEDPDWQVFSSIHQSPGKGDLSIPVSPTHESHSLGSLLQEQATSTTDSADSPTDEAAFDDSGELDESASEDHTNQEETDIAMDNVESCPTVEGTFDDSEQDEFLPEEGTSQVHEPYVPNAGHPSAMQREQLDKEILGLNGKVDALFDMMEPFVSSAQKKVKASNTFYMSTLNALTITPDSRADNGAQYPQIFYPRLILLRTNCNICCIEKTTRLSELLSEPHPYCKDQGNKEYQDL